MEAKITLSPKAIYSKKFTKNVKGYDPDEVDAYLDEVIKDYMSFDAILSSCKTKMDALKGDLEKLKEWSTKASDKQKTDAQKIKTLEVENASYKNKVGSIKEGDAPSAENLDYINRINALESFIYSLGYDPKTLKPLS